MMQPSNLRGALNEVSLRCVLLALFLSIGCEAQSDLALVSTMKGIWSSLNGSSQYWTGNNVCNSTDYNGITCDRTSSYPTSFVFNALNSSSIKLTGSFPPQIGLLTNLTRLDLGSNQLSGSILPSICDLTGLTYIDLSRNLFNGSLPSCLGQLYHLKSLILDTNRLSGSVPRSIANLTSLSQCNLGTNPSLCFPWNVSSICGTTVSNKCASSASLVATMKSIWTTLGGPTQYWKGNQTCNPADYIGVTCDSTASYPVSIVYNPQSDTSLTKLTGRLSPLIGSLSNLTKIDLGINLITGIIPSTICNLTQLTSLDLGFSSITGGLPSCMGTSNLQMVDLFFGGVSANNSILDVIYLSKTSLSGPFPSCITNSLVNLVGLNLGRTALNGSIPDSICNLTGLDYLNLGTAQFSGTIPSCLDRLSNLNSLFLDTNQLSGSVPRSIANLTRLSQCNLGTNPSLCFPWNVSSICGTTVSNKCASSASLVATMKSIWTTLGGPSQYWRGNQICNSTDYIGVTCDPSFTYPVSISTGEFTKTITFNGTLSPLIGDLVNLTRLSLISSFNRFGLYGSITPSICNLTQLYVLELSGNGLTGVIPDCIGTDLVQLTSLVLNTSSLNGTIPDSICNLNQLSTLDLGASHLSGSIPPCIVNLPRLRNLYLDDNHLTGSVSTFSNSPLVNCKLDNNPSLCYPLGWSSICSGRTTDSSICPTTKIPTGTILTPAQAEIVLNNGLSGDVYIETASFVSAVISAVLKNATSFSYNHPEVSIRVQTYDTYDDSIVYTQITNSSISVTLPSSVTTSPKVSVALTSIAYNPFLSIYNESIYSTVTGVSLYGQNGTEINVRDIKDTINITMGIIQHIPSEHYAVCQYWNETSDQWSREGLRLVVDDNVTVCQTSHLTNFSIGVQKIVARSAPVVDESAPAPREDGKKTMIIIIVASCAAGAVILILIFDMRGGNEELEEKVEWIEKVHTGETTVWKALHNGTNTVAVKKVDRDLRKLIGEATRLKTLHHPNIVLYLGQNSSEKWMMTEWMSEGDLFSYSLRNSVSPFIFQIGRDISQAMSYVAEQNLVHTMLTPHHILLQETEFTMVAKVGSFGSCVSDGSRSDKKEGHTAPEVIEDGIQRTSADVWSFGLLLSFIISDGKNSESQVYGQRKSKKRVSTVRAETEWEATIKSLVRDCTDVKVANRPTFKDMAKKLMRKAEETRKEKWMEDEVDHYGMQE
ncbi:putative LRR receptor-like serine/threonine-protein kinase [Planoprotostelium fungivorum]|uniref:Putative LRR receptor-like serine/threonine-protein kinase n=1 Tax=Planoprotostelium fungivorum TaxID=1890364 RepID=A0A2P6NAJ2_9EUKA|nr:putative LRR receptor-like serine/threonine-protein kinase [Planoprotostelium fungivorum]